MKSVKKNARKSLNVSVETKKSGGDESRDSTAEPEPSVKTEPEMSVGEESGNEDAENHQSEDPNTANKKKDESSSRGIRRGRAALSTKNTPVSISPATKSPIKKEGEPEEKTKRGRQTKSVPAASIEIYLEDYFDSICSYQDESQRYIANIFYLLPSPKVRK